MWWANLELLILARIAGREGVRGKGGAGRLWGAGLKGFEQ